MILFHVLNPQEIYEQKQQLATWLYEHLGQYGDSLEAIERSMDYAASNAEGKGGLVITAHHNTTLVACSIVNHTGMGGYIPEDQLVYIAVDKQRRGQGIGQQLLQFTIDQVPGAMALHVEYDNPARFLYQKLGFTNKYAEMRIHKGGS
jgi:[ribosomal protein S18]-alanine N-acetyltransferase